MDPVCEQQNTSIVDVLGINISAVNLKVALRNILNWIQHGQKRYVCVTGVHGVMESKRDESFKWILNNSGMTVPDGMPMVWAGRIYGHNSISRVYGPDLMLAVCHSSVDRGYTHFLYGGREGVSKDLKSNLELIFPGIKIVGYYTPPFRPLNNKEKIGLIKQISLLKPDIFWVGLSTPKQERFMSEHLSKLNTTVMLGVGAAFDFLTGRAIDAPDWVKIIGMQCAGRWHSII